MRCLVDIYGLDQLTQRCLSAGVRSRRCRRRTTRWSGSCSATRRRWRTLKRRRARAPPRPPRAAARPPSARCPRTRSTRDPPPRPPPLPSRLNLTFLSDLSIFLNVLWRAAPSSAPLPAGRLHSRRSDLSIADYYYIRLLFYLSVHKIYLDIIYYVYFLT